MSHPVTHCLLLFSIGVFGVSFLPQLPPLWIAIPAAIISISAITRYRDYRFLGLFLGVVWGVYSGHQLLHQQLPEEFELQEFQVRGVVLGLPQSDHRRTRFRLQVDSCIAVVDGRQLPLNKLQLSWYGERPTIQTGQYWQLRVKLRRPRGFSNPGGFDYRHWLLQQGISATGYVRQTSAESTGANKLLGYRHLWLHELRENLHRLIGDMQLPELQRGLLQALAVGDGSALGSDQWALFNRTGTTHLMVISGLHIGLFSFLCYGLGNLLARPFNLLFPVVPAQLWASVCALLGAGFYAALSGFGLPATRAFAMVVAVLLVRWLRNNASPFSHLQSALAAVALVDPLAAHSTGFWLSFVAVFGLLWVFAPLVGRPAGLQGWLHRWWRPQWTVFVALAALLLAAYGQLPLLSVLINGVAIPWLNIAVVPICLLGVVASFVSVDLAHWCWQLAGWQLQWFYQGLQWLDGSAELMLTLPIGISIWLILPLMVAALLLLLPRGVPARWLGLVPFILVFFAAPTRPPLSVTVLDVGQGLSVVVTTQRHTLVYDTGAAFSERFNVGSAVVAPFLRAKGIHRVDRLVVSHGDNDHAGGVNGLKESLDVGDIWLGESLPDETGNKLCQAGDQWHWEGVEFQILSPKRQPEVKLSSNNSSCVLLITLGDRRVLLPGDIEASQERSLLAQLPPVDIVVAPHHGSRTSSSSAFVEQLQPRHVIYSAGYKHHFGHPHPKVVERYGAVGARQWYTATDGAVTLTLENGSWQVSTERTGSGFFWQ
ncbi:DNA internalization-related competence protein ComEC/Rec2 [Porticoccus sp. W117]|uniref:DNA internalization-related competence protein ComEC/Rec2 n=1 Tax=Porticoccus sp. W117 TaxID=3054777 RepID=UPI002599C54F|nr:DNA internalization-related competence protein ComEC/Rec2 [Porticoccus sp. W117]MDM3872132.1 DNA internalization-related competence protein ComEC/Rec2 [Porticoccus sp. W117]